jgi:hypothetical protein
VAALAEFGVMVDVEGGRTYKCACGALSQCNLTYVEYQYISLPSH